MMISWRPRRYTAEYRHPGSATQSAQADRARSAIAAQAITSSDVPGGSLSEAGEAQGEIGECQSGAIMCVLRSEQPPRELVADTQTYPQSTTSSHDTLETE